MITVFVVDDEPAAIIYMRQLINLVKKEFQIIGEYTDGLTCLTELEKRQPDLVISDIHMPGMSGLELTREINIRYPDVICLILSGYSEFEYAREAIKGRVYEYLLKPIFPDEFIATMNHIRMTISARHLQERDMLIREMYLEKDVEIRKLKRYFENSSYYGILIRKNGLPRKHTQELGRSISSDLYEKITIYGCDEREALCIIPSGCVSQNELQKMSRRLRKGLEIRGDVFTTIITEKPFTIDEMAATIQRLYRKLYQSIIPGKERIYYLNETTVLSELNGENKRTIERIRKLLVESQYKEAYLEFEKLCADFQDREITEKEISRTVYYIMDTCWMFSEKNLDIEEQKKLLDSLMYESFTVKEICENIKILFDIPEQNMVSGKIDTEENYIKIKNYILDHLKDSLSLSKIAEEFSISPAYLTKMFRKYEEMSYNQYLIHVRIEEAKKLLVLHPDWFIKDVANLVGYTDQFYFSRVFRSYTGKCPSDYTDEDEK